YVIFTLVNFLMTLVGVALVDRKGRKFLFMVGTAGIIVSLAGVGGMFLKTEGANLECRNVIQAMVKPDQTLSLQFDGEQAKNIMAARNYAGKDIRADRATLAVIYSYGGFTAATNFVRSDEKGTAPIHITRESAVPSSKFEALLKNPFADLDAARTAQLEIQRAYIGEVPGIGHGWLVAVGLYF